MTWTRTFDQMKLDMGLWLGVDPSTTSPNYTRFPDDVRGSLINEARREIASRRDLRLLEDTHSFNTVASTYLYDLPADWLRPYVAYYLDGSGYYEKLDFVTRAEFDELYAEDLASETGEPEHIAVYGTQFLLGPVPDGAYSINVHYFKVPEDMDGTNDDDFLSDYWYPIFFMACAKACGFLMEFQLVSYYEEEAKKKLGFLSAQETRSRWSGRRLQSNITSE